MKLRIVLTTLAVLALGARGSSQGALASLEADIRKMTDRVTPAVVRVEAGQERTVRLRPELRLEFPASWSEARIGTGFVVSLGSRKRILTSHSVVADASKVTVRFSDEQQVEARVVATDAYFRVAVLDAEIPETVHPLVLGEGEPARGSISLLCGNAHDQGPSLVLGLVCGTRRSHFGFDNFTVVSTPLTPGDSGAPILGSDGRVLGMASAALAGRALRNVSTLACGIPAEDLRRVLDEVDAHGRVRTAWLGVTLADRTPEVRIVVSRSPAATAGVRPGDRIVAVGDRVIASRLELAGALARSVPGTTITLHVLRVEGEKQLEVRLAPRPDRESGDLIEVEGGVQILMVAPRSVTARLRLKPGDVIETVDGKPATSAESVREALARFEKDRKIDLRVLRGELRVHIDYRSR